MGGMCTVVVVGGGVDGWGLGGRGLYIHRTQRRKREQSNPCVGRHRSWSVLYFVFFSVARALSLSFCLVVLGLPFPTQK